MSEILVISDQPLGKLLKKYLSRDCHSVRYQKSIQDIRLPMLCQVIIFDGSDLIEDLIDIVNRLHRETGCKIFIVLRSMENGIPEMETGEQDPIIRISFMAKPIRFSDLYSLIVKELEVVLK